MGILKFSVPEIFFGCGSLKYTGTCATRQSTIAILTFLLVSVTMQKRVISLAVPAVVLMAIKGGIAFVD